MSIKKSFLKNNLETKVGKVSLFGVVAIAIFAVAIFLSLKSKHSDAVATWTTPTYVYSTEGAPWVTTASSTIDGSTAVGAYYSWTTPNATTTYDMLTSVSMNKAQVYLNAGITNAPAITIYITDNLADWGIPVVSAWVPGGFGSWQETSFAAKSGRYVKWGFAGGGVAGYGSFGSPYYVPGVNPTIMEVQMQADVGGDADSTLTAGALSEPATISSNIDTYAERVNVFDFTITDSGVADGLATILQRIIVTRGGNDNTSDWTNYIQGATLTESGGGAVSAGTVAASSITFGSPGTTLYSVANGTNKTYTLAIYLKTSLPFDAGDKVIEFDIDPNDDVMVDATGTGFAAGSSITSASKPIVVDMRVVSNAALGSWVGETAGDYAGSRVFSAGDVNGDGYEDLLIGADSAGSHAGEIYLILGKTTASFSTNVNLSAADASWIGESTGDVAGMTVSSAGDVNGDGYDDILIGASGNGSNTGKVYLILGKSAGWATNQNLSSASDASWVGEAAGVYAGESIASAGDVNGDGYDDILIGARTSDGKTYLILGKTSGWATNVNLSTADASWVAENANDLTDVVSRAGDINGDGYDDIMIGSWRWNMIGNEYGKVYIILGKTSGWATNVSLSTSDASWVDNVVQANLGRRIAAAGDVNGDGYDDILMEEDYAITYLVFGTTTANLANNVLVSTGANASWNNSALEAVSSAGDVNGDGYDDILLGGRSYVPGGRTFLVLGKASGWTTGGDVTSTNDGIWMGKSASLLNGSIKTVSSAGDANGDGHSDVLFGVLNALGVEAGEAYLISPYPNTPPSTVSSVVLKTDATYGTDLASNIDLGNTIYIQLNGSDADVATVNTAVVKITSTSDANGIRVPLIETGVNTGIYRGTARVLNTGSSDFTVNERVRATYGNTVTIAAVNDLSKTDTVVVNYLNDANSTLTAGALSEPATISSAIDTAGEVSNVFDFTVTDLGTADGNTTILQQIIVTRGSNDTTIDWTNYISGARLSDGTSTTTGTIAASSITFGSPGSTLYSVGNGTNKTFVLSIWLKSSLPAGADGKILEFDIDPNDDITIDSAGTSFAAGGSITSGSKPVIAIADNADSTLTAGSLTEPSTILTTADTAGEITNVFDFKVTDLGSGDGLATILKRIVVTKGSNDTTTDWTTYIDGAKLKGTGLATTTGTVAASSITFGDGVADLATVADGANDTYTLSIYLKTSLPNTANGKIIEFDIDPNDDLTINSAGTSFAAGTSVTSGSKPIVTAVAPSAVSDLSVLSVTPTSVVLTWTAVGADGHTGTASSYDLRYSTSAIDDTSWNTATQFSGESTPLIAGSSETAAILNLSLGTTYYFALKTSDAMFATSTLSNVANGRPCCAGGGPGVANPPPVQPPPPVTPPPPVVPPPPTDTTAPAAILGLLAYKPTGSTVTLSWSAPGDDGNTGTATAYDIRYSTNEITESNFSEASRASDTITPSSADSSQTMVVRNLAPETLYYFAIKTRDEVPNVSDISNVPFLKTMSVAVPPSSLPPTQRPAEPLVEPETSSTPSTPPAQVGNGGGDTPTGGGRVGGNGPTGGGITQSTTQAIQQSVVVKKVEDIYGSMREQLNRAEESLRKMSPAISAGAKKTVKQTKEILNTPEGKIVTKTITAVSAGVAVAQGVAATTATASQIFSMGDIFSILLRSIGLVGEVLGIKKRRRKWGIVYDAQTKRPLDPAYVVMKDANGNEIDQRITDMDGRFGFLTVPGKYTIEANKTNYSFPSKIITGSSDALYANLYQGGVLNVMNPEVINVNIPMDPVGIDWNEEAKKKIMGFNPKMEILKKKLSSSLFWGGFGLSPITYLAAPTPLNLGIMAGYVGLGVLRKLGFKAKSYGRIYDKETGQPIPFARVKVCLPDKPEICIGSLVSDITGRYYMLVAGAGKYLLRIAGETVGGKKVENDVLYDAREKVLNKDIWM